MASPAAADSAFGADLYRLLGDGTGGLVLSPASIAAALRLALLGARGHTAAELATALHLSGPGEAAEGLRLLASVPAAGGDSQPGQDARDDQVIFRAPNTVWVQAGLPLQPEYTGAVAALASGEVRDADFTGDPGQARHAINELIEERTAGRIRDLLPPGGIGQLTRLVLASAVYLKAAWEHPFPAGATADAPFHPEPGRDVTVAMMRLTARLGYLRGEGYQAVLLPYRGRRLAMAVILPDGPPAPPGRAG
ncbi:MAG: hypothetical protein J2P34_04720, partial [Actinobacteria bacterium]|nr:hypothetical protein [Actinomycetota bacterium]